MKGDADNLELELATLNRRGTRHVCLTCDYEMFAIDRYRDACSRCGEILTNEFRTVRAVEIAFGGRRTLEVSSRADRT